MQVDLAHMAGLYRTGRFTGSQQGDENKQEGNAAFEHHKRLIIPELKLDNFDNYEKLIK